ncbi:MAG: sugar ABC transporter ATP-binding protein [Acholeplasmatales bacterium]|jgi:ribose transport system ATP-binding protein|nr:sugar ABC transporter ATP-binding protein [Acholeplasmatales bacterium]
MNNQQTDKIQGNQITDFKNVSALLEIKKMVKTFGVVTALNDVTISINRGEIVGLIGENGSGKSTLASIVSGIQKANSGSMFFKGEPWNPVSMIDAVNKGIGIIVQEVGVIAGISIAENIFLGEISKFAKMVFMNKKKMLQEATKTMQAIGCTDMDVSLNAGVLNIQDRKLIEIAKVWMKNPDIFIVDETTTAVSQKGKDIIYDLLNRQKQNDKSAIFISHDIDEIMNVCDRIIVLRDGKFITSLSKNEFESSKIKQLLIGRELVGNYYRSDYDSTPFSKNIILKAKELTGNNLNGVSLDLFEGEILGIGGLSHCGMHELGKAIFGFIPPKSGRVIRYNYSQDAKSMVHISNEAVAMKEGIGYASKDRDIEALVLSAPILDNIASAGYNIIQKAKFLILPQDERKYVNNLIKEFNIKCYSSSQMVSELSGGNKQKVVVAKWAGRGSKIIILDCPTRGIDIGVKQALYQLIYKMKLEGISFIFISEEITELIGLCDRVLIMKNSKITKEFKRDKDLSESDIIEYMI